MEAKVHINSSGGLVTTGPQTHPDRTAEESVARLGSLKWLGDSGVDLFPGNTFLMPRGSNTWSWLESTQEAYSKRGLGPLALATRVQGLTDPSGAHQMSMGALPGTRTTRSRLGSRNAAQNPGGGGVSMR